MPVDNNINSQQNEHQLVESLLSHLDELSQFLKDSSFRNIGTKQKAIIIKQNIKDIMFYADKYLHSELVDQTLLYSTLIQTSMTFNDAKNQIAEEEGLTEINYIIRIAANKWISKIALSRGNFGLSNLEGTSSLIEEYLKNTTKILSIPTKPMKNETNYKNTINIIFNLLLSTIKAYLIPTIEIDHLNIESIKDWGSKAFWHLKLIIDFLVGLNLKDFIQNINDISVEDIKIYYEISLIKQLKLELSFSLAQMLGNGWFQIVETYGLFNKNEEDRIIATIIESNQWITKWENELNELIKSNNFNKTKFPEINELEFITGYNDLNCKIRKLWKEIRFQNLPKNKPLLEELISEILNFYTLQSKLISQDPHYNSNRMQKYYQIIINSLLGSFSLLFDYTNSIEELQTFSQDQNFLFTPNKDNLQYIYIRTLLNLQFHLSNNNQLQIHAIKSELIQMIDSLERFPKYIITVKMLIIVIGLYLEELEINEMNEIIVEIMEIIDKNHIIHLENGIIHYLNQLKLSITNKQQIFSIPKEREDFDIQDILSWIVPVFKSENRSKIVFLPFNRQKDQVSLLSHVHL
ncbi:MAG: hypothetical protein OEY49_18145, partial [Candidatus Heimdallarchaeota archaeon]|nr:hypothetical protein [Candidatus Heimdallarchaeota archaeon]